MNGHTNGSASGTSSPQRIYDVRSIAFPGPTPQSDDYDTIREQDTAIVIDNGTNPSPYQSSILRFRIKSVTRRLGIRNFSAARDREPRRAIQREKSGQDILSCRKRCVGRYCFTINCQKSLRRSCRQ